jgi:hypothetical protein
MKLRDLFKNDRIIRPRIGSRVRHNETRLLGTVQGVAKVKGRIGGFDINALTVGYDNGTMGMMVAENEFTVVGR